MEKTVDQIIDDINNYLNSGKIAEAETEALALYEKNNNSIIILNILGNIYLTKLDFLKAIFYLEEANNLSNSNDGHVLFNLGVAYARIDKEKALKYLNEAKSLLPNDENIVKFISSLGN